ncbi:MAG: hypothetical protein M1813_000920 [Trichoglossum hirsutum]|nr:MAG: hypothetical protein M1813_000920 [Trichoglossum hirsutum]
MPATLNIALKNSTTSGTVYAYITGHAINNNNALFLLQSDAKTPYYPLSPSERLSPLDVDCAIRLGSPGSTTTATIPQLAGARIWFSLSNPLVFLLNPGPGLVEPSVTNPSDPNINAVWGFCEFTFNSDQLFANISYVDFVSIPISLSLTNSSGTTKHVEGISADGLNAVCRDLAAQHAIDGAGWDKLIVTTPTGQNLRALSPNLGIVTNSSLFSGYFDPYVNLVWEKYKYAPLSIDTQAAWGTVTGRVSPDGSFTFSGLGSFSKPNTRDIFSCSTGPFVVNSASMGALIPRFSAAFNRSALLSSSHQPSDNPAEYYTYPITNHYSRIVHAASVDGRGYAFPYDDVAPTGGLDQSGSVFDPNPSLLTVAVGGGGGGDTTGPGGVVSAASTIQAENFSSSHGVDTEPCSDVGGGRDVGWIASGDWIGYRNVDFGDNGMTRFAARVASGATGGISGSVQVALDSPTAAPVGSFAIMSTGGWQNWETVSTDIKIVRGTHTLYLAFASEQPADFVNVNWFNFS